MRLVTRYRCRNNMVLCDQGDGKPRRKKCSYCSGSFLVETGLWGVFEWDRSGRYPADAAKSVHWTRAAALAAGAPTDVVRWVASLAAVG